MTPSRFPLLLAGLVIASAVVACDGPESPQSKAEYAALQTADYQNGDAPLAEPVLREVHGLSVLGVRGNTGRNVWVLLRAKSEPLYKQSPVGVNYSVPEEFVRGLEKDGRVSPEVARWLRKGGI